MPNLESVLTMFSGKVEREGDDVVISVPGRELDLGELTAGETYRVAVLDQLSPETGTADVRAADTPQRDLSPSSAPIAEGEQLAVEIEDTGEQGDGIARVGPGYIVFVPNTSVGDRVTVEITQVRENFAFAEVVED